MKESISSLWLNTMNAMIFAKNSDYCKIIDKNKLKKTKDKPQEQWLHKKR
jgi:hypothetical protein